MLGSQRSDFAIEREARIVGYSDMDGKMSLQKVALEEFQRQIFQE